MSASDDINTWMMSEGRLLGDGVRIVESYAKLLVEAGIPLHRANIAQRVNGGAKRDHLGGVRRDRLAAAGLSP